MYSVIAVANYFIQRSLEEGIPITNFRLQKMSFFAHAAYYKSTGKRLVYDIVEAWPHGPVFPELYVAVKEYGDKPIDSRIAVIDFTNFRLSYDIPEIDMTDTDLVELLTEVWNICSEMNIYKMRQIARDESGAWYKTVKEYGINNIDDDKEVKDKLSKHLVISSSLIKECGI